LTQRTNALLRWNERAYAVVERDHPDAITADRRNIAENERRRQHVFEPREAAGELRHGPSAVDERDDRLRPLDRLLARDQVSMARGRFPIKKPRVVPGNVVAEPGERRTFSSLLEHVHADFAESIVNRQESETADVRQRGHDHDVRVHVEADQTRDQSAPRLDAPRHGTEPEPAAPVGQHGNGERVFVRLL